MLKWGDISYKCGSEGACEIDRSRGLAWGRWEEEWYICKGGNLNGKKIVLTSQTERVFHNVGPE